MLPYLTAFLLLSGLPPEPQAFPSPSVQGPGPTIQLVAEKEPNAKIVRVTAAQIQSEQIAGAWFYTLKVNAVNNTSGTVNKVFINYEIYAPNSQKLLFAGKAALQPQNLLTGEEGRAQLMVNQGGRVKVTLVEWISPEKGYKTYEQMQEFP
ncbi:hypothetical protein RIF25_06085 [Thermosynechococcaceae cyanobacterium BACA0444]|uniref:Uncharacterized protein n=1 Tax=Pseudocalidococcus azoricus BACA0444 TaxID=2918990 RepID=A0AAE4FQE3_9CYAN|nr:hypothetical protein [Pseudocalidococcus azoricus]MDS3860374.1 hypothetical protein [Pseudocalidococcus azoricus BACA0444]